MYIALPEVSAARSEGVTHAPLERQHSLATTKRNDGEAEEFE